MESTKCTVIQAKWYNLPGQLGTEIVHALVRIRPNPTIRLPIVPGDQAMIVQEPTYKGNSHHQNQCCQIPTVRYAAANITQIQLLYVFRSY